MLTALVARTEFPQQGQRYFRVLDVLGGSVVAVPLLVDDAMQIGYLTHKQVQPGPFGKRYIEILQKHTAQ